MPRDVPRAEIYRGVINLWVEDTLTREYLSAVWQGDPGVTFFIGGGNEGVRAIVKDAEEAGFRNVFGLTDRDYRPSNRAGWNDSKKSFQTFVLPVHEIENYLLDAEALHSSRLNNRKLEVAGIERQMKDAAGRLCWWAACREVIAELKRRFREPFVEDPGCDLSDPEGAERHICESDWFRKLGDEAARTTTSDVRKLLEAGYQQARERIADGTWRSEFAGKEILSDIGSRICDHPRLANRMTRSEFHMNLAKDVADWQVQQGRVPSDLIELRSALEVRINRQADENDSK